MRTKQFGLARGAVGRSGGERRIPKRLQRGTIYKFLTLFGQKALLHLQQRAAVNARLVTRKHSKGGRIAELQVLYQATHTSFTIQSTPRGYIPTRRILSKRGRKQRRRAPSAAPSLPFPSLAWRLAMMHTAAFSSSRVAAVRAALPSLLPFSFAQTAFFSRLFLGVVGSFVTHFHSVFKGMDDSVEAVSVTLGWLLMDAALLPAIQLHHTNHPPTLTTSRVESLRRSELPAPPPPVLTP